MDLILEIQTLGSAVHASILITIGPVLALEPSKVDVARAAAKMIEFMHILEFNWVRGRLGGHCDCGTNCLLVFPSQTRKKVLFQFFFGRSNVIR